MNRQQVLKLIEWLNNNQISVDDLLSMLDFDNTNLVYKFKLNYDIDLKKEINIRCVVHGTDRDGFCPTCKWNDEIEQQLLGGDAQ